MSWRLHFRVGAKMATSPMCLFLLSLAAGELSILMPSFDSVVTGRPSAGPSSTVTPFSAITSTFRLKPVA